MSLAKEDHMSELTATQKDKLMADLRVVVADAEVKAFCWLAARVRGPALSARCTARTLAARSTTVAVTAVTRNTAATV